MNVDEDQLITYEQLYEDINTVAVKMKAFSTRNKVLIPIGRGGWFMGRVLAEALSEIEIKNDVYTIITGYDNLENPAEFPILKQGLDQIAIENIKSLVSEGWEIWLLDPPFVTGKTIKLVKNYILKEFGVTALISALHVVRFDVNTKFPWRVKADYLPNVFAKLYKSKNQIYINYPWEYSDLDKLN